MKALSLKQAARCETAKTPKCKCRCHGALHGSRRNLAEWDGPVDQQFFEALPADDPHHIDDAETKKRKRKERRKPPSRQLPLIPPGLEQEMLGGCARCGQDEWIHHTYWRENFGADHEFVSKEAS